MALEIKVPSPAKINLNLKVLPPRKDGFHEIESIFRTVSLQDIVTIRTIEGNGSCVCSCDSMELPEDNTLTRTYKAFETVTGIALPSFEVHVEKHIPAGGGLGGGSSNAASFAKAISQILGKKLSSDECSSIASLVGSDVFFFFSCDEEGKGAALVSGRGEVVQKIKDRTDLFYLMVFPDVHSSTKEAYSLVDEHYDELKKLDFPSFDELEEIFALSPEKWSFQNSFTPVLKEKYDLIGNALSMVKESGASFSDMSGSGSTVFGVFETEEAVRKAYSLLSKKYYCAIAQ